jgi:hypothetical protein
MLVEHGNGTIVIDLAPDQGLINVSGRKIMHAALNDGFVPGAPEHFAAMILLGLIKHWRGRRHCRGSGHRLNKVSCQCIDCGHGVLLSNFRLGATISAFHNL